MIGINKGPIVLNLKTVFVNARAGAQPQPLGKGRMVACVIQNRLTNIDGTGNGAVLMVGFGTGQIYQMQPGQESPLIYAKDLEDIYIRSDQNSGTHAAVDVTVFVYQERGSER